MIAGSGLIGLLITLVILGLIFYAIWWFIGYIALPAPFDKVARVLVALVALIVIIDILLSIQGGGLGIGRALRW